MEELIVKTNSFDSIIKTNGRSFAGFKYENNEIHEIDGEVLSYLNKLLLGNNKKLILKKDGYDVFLDLDTNLKHFYKDGIEDIKMFFTLNGMSTTCYKNNHDIRDDEYRKFEIGRDRIYCMVVASLTALTMTMSVLALNVKTGKMTRNEALGYLVGNTDPIELYDIKSDIYSSSKLTDEEKAFLYNEDFISDVLETKNSSAFAKYFINKKFNNIKISAYDKENGIHKNADGFYNLITPNTLFVANYKNLDDEETRDTVAHEFVHMMQESYGYNLLIEATAEIISSEYYNTKVDVYSEQVYLTKILMEIIGPEPIWNYVLTNDFSLIEKRVKPFLTDEEYKIFLKNLNFNRKDYEKQLDTFDNLMNIMLILYKNVYGVEMSSDEVIRLLDSTQKTNLQRYYFNNRKINEENSYYLTRSKKEENKIYSFKEAYDQSLIKFYARFSCDVYDLPKAQELINKDGNEKRLERVVTVTIHEKEVNGIIKYYCDPEITNMESTNKEDLEEYLIKKGLGHYKVVELIPITYTEYKEKNHNANDGIMIRYDGDKINVDKEVLMINRESIETIKHTIPTIYEKTSWVENIEEVK